MLHPLALRDVRARPERHLVVLPPEVHERDREPAALRLFDGDDGRVRHVLEQERLLLRGRFGGGELVGGGDEEQLEGDRLAAAQIRSGEVQ